MSTRRVRRYGDAGLLVETPSNGAALALCAALAASGLAVRARPGLRSVLVQPAVDGANPADLGALARAVAALPEGDSAPPAGRTVELPVVYDGEDLPEVAARTGLGVAEVVARHAAPEYTVGCLGFTAGFAYLEGLDEALHLPRRDSPRARVPAGSVAVAGDQAGVYPRPAPGGWHLLGRTSAAVFDEAADPPALLAPGDRVRFVPVPP
jgi:KipI family sensor histidine kinase inhibitor